MLVAAHRGNSRVAPENTLPAFTSALQLGVDLVELDYRHSADGVPTVFHDETLDRTTDAARVFGRQKVRLAEMPATELPALDAGGWFGPEFRGTAVPSLEEAVRTIVAGGATPLIERKCGDAAACIEVLRRTGTIERAIVQAFDWDFLAECRRLAPELTLVALGKDEFSPRVLDQLPPTGAVGVAWEDRTTTALSIDAIHQHGLKAWVWTADDPQRMRQLIGWGIDAIITNVPAVLKSVLTERAG